MKLKPISEKRYVRQFGEPSISYKQLVSQKKKLFIAKRVIDIIFSLIVCIGILSWMIPLFAILIKLSSKGPVFFVQKRVGLGGKSFYCLKFRTMVVNAEADTLQSDETDTRITRIGSFLRNSNLDEFPQFINVLLGDMSIVGPRPHMHSDANFFNNVIPNYKSRYFVKPGITGLAQVKGYRGAIKTYEDIFHRYQFDAFYIRNVNLGLDLRIIRNTALQTLQILHSKLTFRSQPAPAAVQKTVA